MSEQRRMFKTTVEERRPGYSKFAFIVTCSVCGERKRYLGRANATQWADRHENVPCVPDPFGPEETPFRAGS